MTNDDRHGFRYRTANEDTWSVIEGIADPTKRRGYVEFLRNKEWVVFTPRQIDFERFDELLKGNSELREWIETASDDKMVAERLALEYPQIFITIDHAYLVEIDWKIKRTRRRPGGGGGSRPDDSAPIPIDLLSALSDDELSMLARQMLRQEVKALNADSTVAIELMREKARKERDPKRRRLYEFLRRFMKELVGMKFENFVPTLRGGTPFPSMHVRIWYQQIQRRGSALIVGDVGTQKTSAAVVGLDGLGAKRILVVCRSYARQSVWHDDVRQYYRDQPDPIVVSGCDDLPRLERMTPDDLERHKFCVIGYGNVQSSHQSEEGDENGDRLVRAVARLKPDAIIIDEAHAINHTGKRSSRVLRLARLNSVRHRIMLTATPFENHPNEVAHLATLLDPEHFPTEDKFHTLCRKNPRIFFAAMAQRMCDYFAQGDVLDLPPANYSPLNMFPHVELECPPDLRLAHEAIQNDGSLDPGQQVFRMTRLLTLPYVARDWYPELGDLRCFRDPLRNPKLSYLRKEVAARIKRGKVVIASGIYASGITRSLEGAEDDLETYEIASLFERWFPGKVLRFDAQETNGNGDKKRAVVERWQNDPDARILIVAVPAAAESVSFTLTKTRDVKHLSIFHLTLPWKPTQYMQFNGRYRRPKMELPVEVCSLVVKGTADEALLELNEKKWRNFLIGVHGMPILTEEEDAIERATFAKLQITPSQWLREAFGRMLGMGEVGIRKFLGETLVGLGVAKTIAEYYITVEDHGTSGHVARFMTPVLKQWHESGAVRKWGDVLDAPCGPLVLERRLNAAVYGLDINRTALDAGREHSYHGGKNAREGCLSNLPAEWSEKFSVVVCSLGLHLTSKKVIKGEEAERVRILRQLNRVMRGDSLLWCTVPEFCFREESFDSFLSVMPNFGFEVVESLTGCVSSLDHPKHPFRFWSLLLRKRGLPAEETLDVPLFAFERSYETRVGPKAERGRKQPERVESSTIRHERFSVKDRFGVIHDPLIAAVNVVGRDLEMKRLHEALVSFLGIQDERVSERLRKELQRANPQSWNQFKTVWKRIKEMVGAPKIEWAKLQRYAMSFFTAQKKR